MNGVDSVIRLRRERVGDDRYGNPLYEVAETPIAELALFAPRDVIPSPEPGRAPVIVEPTLYWFQSWPDVRADDKLRVRGVEYEVQSIPAEWRSPAVGGLVVKLRDSAEGVP